MQMQLSSPSSRSLTRWLFKEERDLGMHVETSRGHFVHSWEAAFGVLTSKSIDDGACSRSY